MTMLIIAKKEGTVRLITESLRINQQLVIKSYPLTRIFNTIRQLEGLKYAKSLKLKMDTKQ